MKPKKIFTLLYRSFIIICLSLFLQVLTSCNILSTVGTSQQTGVFARPIASLKDTLQVATYISGFVENSPSSKMASDEFRMNKLNKTPRTQQASLNIHQYRDFYITSKGTTHHYLSYALGIYGGKLTPFDHYKNYHFKPPRESYRVKKGFSSMDSPKYFGGFSGNIGYGFTFTNRKSAIGVVVFSEFPFGHERILGVSAYYSTRKYHFTVPKHFSSHYTKSSYFYRYTTQYIPSQA